MDIQELYKKYPTIDLLIENLTSTELSFISAVYCSRNSDVIFESKFRPFYKVKRVELAKAITHAMQYKAFEEAIQ